MKALHSTLRVQNPIYPVRYKDNWKLIKSPESSSEMENMETLNVVSILSQLLSACHQSLNEFFYCNKTGVSFNCMDLSLANI